MTGAGFGGSVVALVDDDTLDDFWVTVGDLTSPLVTAPAQDAVTTSEDGSP